MKSTCPRPITLLAPLLACLCLAAAAQKAAKDLPVTTTIRVADPDVAASLQFRGDGAPYTNSRYVQSIIQGIGDWEMMSDYSTSSTRKVFVDFSQPIAGSCPTCPNTNPVAPASQLYATRFIAKCAEYGNNFFTLPLGSTMACPMFTRVVIGGQNYRIHMQSNPGSQGYYQGTDHVNVTCTGANSLGKCNRWRVGPSADYLRADGTLAKGSVGKLVKVTTVNRQTVNVDQGNFYFSFSIDVTNP